PDLIAFVARSCLDWFGSQRCMFGTNFPVEKIWTDMDTLVGAWRAALADEAESVQRDVFSETARRVYRL
ncbi:MAG TPA: amidohydrolase family protein, partial [Egibacteraceae bacterium]